METVIYFMIGIFIGLILMVIKKSIYMPKPRTIQAIMFFGKLYTFISNINGKIIYKGEDDPYNDRKKWDLIDDSITKNKNIFSNIHFFIWPIFSLYKFSLTYTKNISLDEKKPGDHILWKKKKKEDEDEDEEIIISRSSVSDHLEFRVSYPTITLNLKTEELASVDIHTNNMMEITNPGLALFQIKDWMKSINEMLYGGLRTLISEREIKTLNLLPSEGTFSNFDEQMKIVVGRNGDNPGLEDIGFKLFKSIFKDFRSANEKSQELLDSYTDITIVEEKGKAQIIMAKKKATATIAEAGGDAKAYIVKQKPIVEWRKKYLVDTGHAKIDSTGNITELVPDANVRVGADALAELKDLKGTLVINSQGVTEILNLNDPQKLNPPKK